MRWGDRTTLLGVTGSVSLVVGAYLPWIRVNPGRTYYPLVYIYGMDVGFAALDRYLLLVASVAFLAGFLGRWQGLRALAHAAAGALATLLVAAPLGSEVGFGPGYPFTPDVGWYVTLVGALALFLTGAACALAELRGAAPARAS